MKRRSVLSALAWAAPLALPRIASAQSDAGAGHFIVIGQLGGENRP